MSGNTNKHISDFLSEYLENLLDSLSSAKFIQIIENDGLEDENSSDCNNNEIVVTSEEIVPQNLCLISAFYNIKVSSIEFISRNMNVDDTYDSLLRLISLTPIIQENCIIRKGDINMMIQLSKDIRLNSIGKDDTLVSKKIKILLNSYLRRHKWYLTRPIVKADIYKLINSVMSLIYPMVDISSSFGWTETTLKIMELCQMFVQAIVDPVADKLKQLPGVKTSDQVKIFNELGVFDVYDLINLEDERRIDLLYNKAGLDDEDVNKIARVCNNFPIIETEYTLIQVEDDNNCKTNKTGREVSSIKRRKTENPVNGNTRTFEFNSESEIIIVINIRRDFNPDEDMDNQLVLDDLEYYPLKEKIEKWWILLLEKNGDSDHSSLREEREILEQIGKQNEYNKNDERIIGIKIVTLNKEKNEITLKFNSNSELNTITNYKLLLVCDSFIGCDQEFCFNIKT